VPWFYVDDDFAFHPKAAAAGDTAIGLWTRAGSYSMKYLTEGFISHDALRQLRAKPAQVKALVDAKARPAGTGLWVPVDGGYRYHDWDDRQRSRDQVEADRASAAERARRYRERKTSRRDALRDGEERHAVSHASPRLVPALSPPNPLLTLAGRLGEVDAHGLAAGLPDEVRDEWQAIAGPGIDLEAEARAYLAHHGDEPPRHPRRAWLGWLAKAREHAAPNTPLRPACGRPDCVGGWLDAGDNDTPVPCPACKPHLKAVKNPEAS
jgi:hypothetical protein